MLTLVNCQLNSFYSGDNDVRHILTNDDLCFGQHGGVVAEGVYSRVHEQRVVGGASHGDHDVFAAGAAKRTDVGLAACVYRETCSSTEIASPSQVRNQNKCDGTQHVHGELFVVNH